jgi:pimeloyl-ACP methyl ester carboxylesterase
MPFANVNGQKLYYEDTGGDGPVIVFSHGLLMDGSMFAPQVEALRGQWRCITWDERGHGQTADPTVCEPFTYYDSANDLAALMAHLGVQKAVLAGMSQGGYLSLRCALTHPELVRALVLIDTQALQEDATKMTGHAALIQEWVERGLSDEVAGIVAHIILGDGWEGTPDWQTKWRRATVPNLLQCFTTLGSRDDISEKIRAITAPALVIHGTLDHAIDLDRAQAMADALPNARMVTVPGGGHAANLTHPEPVNAAIRKFLADLT